MRHLHIPVEMKAAVFLIKMIQKCFFFLFNSQSFMVACIIAMTDGMWEGI